MTPPTKPERPKFIYLRGYAFDRDLLLVGLITTAIMVGVNLYFGQLTWAVLGIPIHLIIARAFAKLAYRNYRLQMDSYIILKKHYAESQALKAQIAANEEEIAAREREHRATNDELKDVIKTLNRTTEVEM